MRSYFDDIAWYFFIFLHSEYVLEDGERVSLAGLDMLAYFIVSYRGIASRAGIIVLLHHYKYLYLAPLKELIINYKTNRIMLN